MKRFPLIILALLLLAPAAGAQSGGAVARFPTLTQLPVFDIRKEGAKANDTSDAVAVRNTVALNVAIANASAVNGIVLIPRGAGTFTVKPQGLATYVRLRSNVVIGGGALRVASNAGNYQALFWDAGSTITNVAIRDLTVDQNPTGNSSADIRTYNGTTVLDNGQCQFLIYVTGANSSNLEVSGCTFDKCCGVNTVAINSTGISGVRFFNNTGLFQRGSTTGTMPAWPGAFNGAAGYDASFGYFACRNVQGYGNKLTCATYADFNGGIEIHGVEQKWHDNEFNGVYTAFSIVPPYTQSENQFAGSLVFSNVTVENNHINRANVAIALQLPGISPGVVNASGWKVHNNDVTIWQGTGHHDSTQSAGIWLQDNGPSASTLDGFEVTDNRIEFETDTRAGSTLYNHALSTTQHGILLSMRTPLRNGTITGNKVRRAPATGIQVGYVDAASEVTNVLVRGNETIDAGANPNNAAVNTNNQRAHFDITGGTLTNVRVFDNDLTDTGGTTNVGLYGMRLGPMAAPSFSYAGNNRHQTGLLPLLPYYHDFGANLLGINYIDTLVNGGTIAHQQMPVVRFAPTANRTGMLLTAGTYHEQRVTLFNEGANSLTFAAPGTYGVAGASNVAAGTSEVIRAKSRRTFVWNAVVNQWFGDGN